MILLPLASTLYIQTILVDYGNRDGTLPTQYRMGTGLVPRPHVGWGLYLSPLYVGRVFLQEESNGRRTEWDTVNNYCWTNREKEAKNESKR